MKNNVHAQHADQTVKGGLLGLFTYLAMKYSMDPALTALLMPLIAGVLSWASSRIGDPKLASLIGSVPEDGKPLKVAASKKAPAKKVAAVKKK
jgi:hypothetical protein